MQNEANSQLNPAFTGFHPSLNRLRSEIPAILIQTQSGLDPSQSDLIRPNPTYGKSFFANAAVETPKGGQLWKFPLENEGKGG